jgi:hypothetical protein
VNHPGRDAVQERWGDNYCQQCVTGQDAAQKKVNKHVEPKECFIVFKGGDKWEPLPGTGCAHWVAHKKGIAKGSVHCIAGCTLRVKDVVSGRQKVKEVKLVRVGDIWVQPDFKHCGLVTKVVHVKDADPKILITHDSSGQGKVATNDFATRFKSEGDFYR